MTQVINPQRETNKIISFLRSVRGKEKIENVLIALSGGIDSATCVYLAAKAIGKDHVYPLLLPYGKLNAEGEEDARLVITSLNIPAKNVRTINIKLFVDSVIEHEPDMDDGRKGNIMARIRMIILYDMSKKLNYLVLGTENKTEHLLGYYTRFGDEASDIEPIRRLYKTQVYALAKHLKIPKKILNTPPTAGLWKGQTDEGEFGFDYKFADEILYLHTEKHLSKKEILAKGFDKKLVDRLWWWLSKGEFKDRLPHVLID